MELITPGGPRTYNVRRESRRVAVPILHEEDEGGVPEYVESVAPAAVGGERSE